MKIDIRKIPFYCWLLLFSIVIQSCQTKETVDFNAQIKPILNKRCISCHGGVKKSGGFSLLFEEEAFEKEVTDISATKIRKEMRDKGEL